jgi:histidine phosphotransferase ChpT
LAGERRCLPKAAVKTLLNLAQIAIDALVRGGTVEIAAEMRNDGGRPVAEIVVRGAGPRIAFDHSVGHALEGRLPVADLSSRTAPAALLAAMAARLGARCNMRWVMMRW